jgi:hypothetical protein
VAGDGPDSLILIDIDAGRGGNVRMFRDHTEPDARAKNLDLRETFFGTRSLDDTEEAKRSSCWFREYGSWKHFDYQGGLLKFDNLFRFL